MYEIRLLKKDGKPTLIWVTAFLSEAKNPPLEIERLNYYRAEIWSDDECIRTIYRAQ